ncbi:hypothetical protein U1Q18_036387, partial [Sarracenia purpurea var. burkii]
LHSPSEKKLKGGATSQAAAGFLKEDISGNLGLTDGAERFPPMTALEDLRVAPTENCTVQGKGAISGSVPVEDTSGSEPLDLEVKVGMITDKEEIIAESASAGGQRLSVESSPSKTGYKAAGEKEEVGEKKESGDDVAESSEEGEIGFGSDGDTISDKNEEVLSLKQVDALPLLSQVRSGISQNNIIFVSEPTENVLDSVGIKKGEKSLWGWQF